MPKAGEVLVAILNNQHDLAIARQQHWYRIPVSSMRKWLAKRWPPEWIAFYHTKALAPLSYGVYFYARVIEIRRTSRWQIFPDQPHDRRGNRQYYQILFEPLRLLPQPILSRRWRRIIFIPTTYEKFFSAVEINDLYDDSPLEDRLWVEFKRLQIDAERQEFVTAKSENYALDFAIYCRQSNLDIETDGDLYHANRERAASDNLRDNNLKTVGWRVLRFNTVQIREQMAKYCVPTVLENINRLDGIDDGRLVPRKFDPDRREGPAQLSLFDDLE